MTNETQHDTTYREIELDETMKITVVTGGANGSDMTLYAEDDGESLGVHLRVAQARELIGALCQALYDLGA